jgi:hypothetical protein
MAWLRADVDTPSSAAAKRKLRRRQMTEKMFKSARSALDNAGIR